MKKNDGAKAGKFRPERENSFIEIDNVVFWLGADGVVMRLDGFTPTRINEGRA